MPFWEQDTPGDWNETTEKAGGNVSVSVTPAAVDGPRLVAVTVKVTLLETVVELGWTVWETPRSAAGLIVVTKDDELFPNAGSAADELILTLLVFGPATRGLAVIVKAAVPLLARVPNE